MELPAIPVPPRDPQGRWDLSEVLTWQRMLGERVEVSDRIGPVRRVAGADVAYDSDERLHAAIVVLDAVSLAPIETSTIVARARFPYLSGLLSLRESSPIVEALSRLRERPDLLMVDGHGYAHPRRFGIACYLGLRLDLPVIGVAKSVLVGTFDEPAPVSGSSSPLVYRGETVGEVVRTREGVAPVFVSVGHRISLATARKWVLACSAGFRVPEPTRRAHLVVTGLRAGRRIHGT